MRLTAVKRKKKKEDKKESVFKIRFLPEELKAGKFVGSLSLLNRFIIY